MRAARLVLIWGLGALLAGCRSPAPGFFPLGIYAPGSTNNLQAIRSAGFNLVTGPASRDFLEAAGQHQLHLLAAIPSTPGRAFAAAPIQSTVRRFDANPNLWAWYVVDEPDLNGISPADVVQANRAVKRFGRKPTAVVLYSGSEALDYAAIPDLLMIDRYPVPWLPLANFSQNVRLARFAAGPKKPLIAVIQVFDWNYHPELLGNRPNREGSCDALAAESGRDALAADHIGNASSPKSSAPTNGAPFVPRDAGVARSSPTGRRSYALRPMMKSGA